MLGMDTVVWDILLLTIGSSQPDPINYRVLNYKPKNQIKMDSKVVVTADAAGNVIIRSSKNPTYGHIRVEQTRMIVDETGFARKKKLSALIPGTIEDLKSFNWTANQVIEGKIVIKESLTPFNKYEPERDYKVAGQSQVVCRNDEQPIYRKHFYSLSPNSEDVLVAHTNGEEIQAAYAVLKEHDALSSDTDFTL